MAKMFLGTKGNAREFQAPERGMQHTTERFYTSTSFLNGGGQSYASKAFRNVYGINISPTEMYGPQGLAYLREMLYSLGDDEFLYYVDPVAARGNIFCSQWANPSLLELGDWINIYSKEPLFEDATPAARQWGYPKRGATFQLDGLANTPNSEFTSLIPPGHTLHLGAAGSAGGTAGLRVLEETGVDELLYQNDSAYGSFEQSAGDQVLEQNLAAYGSMETAQSGTTIVRTNLHTNPRLAVGQSSFGSAGPTGARVAIEGVPDTSFTFRSTGDNSPSGSRVYTSLQNLVVGATYSISAIIERLGQNHYAYVSTDSNNANAQTIAAPATGTGFEEVQGTFVATRDLMYFHVRLTNTGTVTSTRSMTRILLEQTDQKRPFFDGASPNEKGFVTAWSGASNNSPSTMAASVVTVRENLFQNPLAAVVGAFESAAAGADGSYITDFPGYGTAYRLTRASTSAARVGMRSPLPGAAQVTVTFEVNASVAITSGTAYFRPSVGLATDQVDLGSVNIPAGRSTIRFTGVTPADMTGTNAGFAMIYGGTAIGSTLDITAVKFEVGNTTAPFFSGSTPNSGDFINAWSGAANASTSVQQGVQAAGFSTSQAAAILSWDWKKAGSTSLRVISTGSAIGYAELSSSPLGATDLATLVVIARLTAPAAPSGSGRARSLTRLGVGETNSQAPNVAGEHVLQQVSSTGSRVLLYAGNSAGQGDMWYDNLTIAQGGHPDLMPWDGSSPNVDADIITRWTGTPFASTAERVATRLAGISYNISLAAAIRSTMWAREGSASARILPRSASNDTFADFSLGFTLTPGMTVSIATWVRLEAPLASNAAHGRRIRIGLTTASGAVVIESPQAPNEAGVHLIQWVFTVPANFTSLGYSRLYNGSPLGGGSIWYDNLTVAVGNHPALIPFTGDTVNNEVRGQWLGAPYTSASRLYEVKSQLLALGSTSNAPAFTLAIKGNDAQYVTLRMEGVGSLFLLALWGQILPDGIAPSMPQFIPGMGSTGLRPRGESHTETYSFLSQRRGVTRVGTAIELVEEEQWTDPA